MQYLSLNIVSIPIIIGSVFICVSIIAGILQIQSSLQAIIKIYQEKHNFAWNVNYGKY